MYFIEITAMCMSLDNNSVFRANTSKAVRIVDEHGASDCTLIHNKNNNKLFQM